jgi:hypothetical protein
VVPVSLPKLGAYTSYKEIEKYQQAHRNFVLARLRRVPQGLGDLLILFIEYINEKYKISQELIKKEVFATTQTLP